MNCIQYNIYVHNIFIHTLYTGNKPKIGSHKQEKEIKKYVYKYCKFFFILMNIYDLCILMRTNEKRCHPASSYS